MKSLTKIVLLCESQLGWEMPPSDKPMWQRLGVEVGKIKAVMRKDPSISVYGLEMALKYSVHKKLSLASPVVLCFRQKEALAFYGTAVKSETDLEARRHQAIDWEMEKKPEDYGDWCERLYRASGVGLTELLDEHKKRKAKEVRRDYRRRVAAALSE